LLDQIISLFGEADHAIFFDCRSEEVSVLQFPKDLALIIANSGEKRDLTEGGYNQRRDETRAAARALEVMALRDYRGRTGAAALAPGVITASRRPCS
jgi:galactokinase